MATSSEDLAMQLELEGIEREIAGLSKGPSKTECTTRLYSGLKKLWIGFKQKYSITTDNPSEAMICKFFGWYAALSKGKLDKHSSLDTLCWNAGRFGYMIKTYYKHNIPQQTLDTVRQYIREVLQEKLDLKDVCFSKEIACWEDIKIAICYLWAEDCHVYRQNRFRVQLAFIFLLHSETGERPGAVTRSESYRSEETALCYKDTELFLRPSGKWALRVTFNNRKGERLDPESFLTITFEEDDDVLGHDLILMFQTLAILDEAFEESTTPAELLNIRNDRSSELVMKIKPGMRNIPLLRRLENSGGLNLSDKLPYSAGSCLTESQRIFHATGNPKRFTLYNIRRGIANEVDGKISTAEKIQLMGHSDKSDRIYRRWYQSRIYTAPVGDIFKGRKPSHKTADYLNMHSTRDPAAPLEIPKELLMQYYDADEEIQRLLETRRLVGDNTAERTRIRKRLGVRKQVIRKQQFKAYRAKWFEARPGDIIRAQRVNGSGGTSSPKLIHSFDPEREAVIKALYPGAEQPTCSRLEALERLVKYCKLSYLSHSTSMRPLACAPPRSPPSKNRRATDTVPEGLAGLRSETLSKDLVLEHQSAEPSHPGLNPGPLNMKEQSGVRLRAACDRCTSKKCRCLKPDGAEKCDRCGKMNAACVFSPFRPEKGPLKTNRKNRAFIVSQLDALEGRLDSLQEQIIAGAKPKHTSEDTDLEFEAAEPIDLTEEMIADPLEATIDGATTAILLVDETDRRETETTPEDIDIDFEAVGQYLEAIVDEIATMTKSMDIFVDYREAVPGETGHIGPTEEIGEQMIVPDPLEAHSADLLVETTVPLQELENVTMRIREDKTENTNISGDTYLYSDIHSSQAPFRDKKALENRFARHGHFICQKYSLQEL